MAEWNIEWSSEYTQLQLSRIFCAVHLIWATYSDSWALISP